MLNVLKLEKNFSIVLDFCLEVTYNNHEQHNGVAN